MFDPVINSLPAFAGYFATAIGLLAVFVLLYVFVTPYNEMALIREGNTAAAISLGRMDTGTWSHVFLLTTSPPSMGAILTPHMCLAMPNHWNDAETRGGA